MVGTDSSCRLPFSCRSSVTGRMIPGDGLCSPNSARAFRHQSPRRRLGPSSRRFLWIVIVTSFSHLTFPGSYTSSDSFLSSIDFFVFTHVSIVLKADST